MFGLAIGRGFQWAVQHFLSPEAEGKSPFNPGNLVTLSSSLAA
jgi:hypothetical protein